MQNVKDFRNHIESPVSPTRARTWQLSIKRAIDVAGSTSALILLAPVFLVIAIAIWSRDGFPILYPWRVVGKDGIPFLGWKFRTMVRNADQEKHLLQNLNEMSGPVFKIANDPRVTRLGRTLRRFSLDELPQLWSVFKGDMSLVGPRPPLVEEYERFEEWQKNKLSVIPGMTCLWQIRGRSDIKDFNEWVSM